MRITTRIDRDLLDAALATVTDPETGRALAELGMLGEPVVDRRGRVRVPIALPTPDWSRTDALRRAVAAAVRTVPGVVAAEVPFGAMDQGRRAEVGRRLRAQRRPLGGALSDGPRVYAVASGKGGVGKSSVTANLAAALAGAGRRVGVLDADVWGYSVPQLFGVRHAPAAFDGIMLPVSAYEVALMSIGFFVSVEQPVVWRGPMLHKALQQFIEDVSWGDLDVLLVDLPPGTGDVALSLLELLPDTALLAVTTPQQAARTVASRIGRLARDAGMPVAGVIENMTAAVCGECGAHSAVFGSGGGARLAEEVEAPLLGQVPLDVALREAGDRGVPVVTGVPEAASAVELRRIALGLPVVRRGLAGRSLPLFVS